MKKTSKAKASKIKVNASNRYVVGKGKHAKIVECSKEEKKEILEKRAYLQAKRDLLKKLKAKHPVKAKRLKAEGFTPYQILGILSGSHKID
ncbi:MAG: hypothetical protein DRI98_11865 [Bacteroidetes bacterium]|nr:MAG: hypothetical protein DRI98_11865 [Bacteroidota bacterium]